MVSLAIEEVLYKHSSNQSAPSSTPFKLEGISKISLDLLVKIIAIKDVDEMLSLIYENKGQLIKQKKNSEEFIMLSILERVAENFGLWDSNTKDSESTSCSKLIRFGCALVQNDIINELKRNDRQNDILQISTRRVERQLTVRNRRLNQLQETVGRGGACFFGLFITPSDIEDVSERLWQGFLANLEPGLRTYCAGFSRPLYGYFALIDVLQKY